jgi:hypothetical protein
MSARLRASYGKIAELPFVGDDHFLGKVVDILERLRSESERRGHPLLASLLEITRGEAEDDLKTYEETLRLESEPRMPKQMEDDEGVLRMAEKLAWSANREGVM